MFFGDSFNSYKKKYALLMCNDLKSCKKDVEKLEKMLTGFAITKKIHCYPKEEIIKFLHSIKITKDDLIYIHYSGHGVKRGKNINGNIKIVSSWINPNRTVATSDQIDSLLSSVRCNIILTTDCCHSESFGDLYSGTSPFIFIGTSLLGELSRSSITDGGSLINTFEYLINNNIEITLNSVSTYHLQLFKKKLIIKVK